MSRRAALPSGAVTVTPGYTWRLDLDILFGGERPADWNEWAVRMHIWSACGLQIILTANNGVSFEEVDFLTGTDETATIPVIRLTAQQTSRFTKENIVNYLIDIAPPLGEIEDYFYGSFQIFPGPPLGMVP